MHPQTKTLLLLNQLIQHSIDSETRDGFDVRFARDVFPVGDDRMDGEVQLVGYLLVGETLRHEPQHILLPRGEFAALRRVLVRALGTGGP